MNVSPVDECLISIHCLGNCDCLHLCTDPELGRGAEHSEDNQSQTDDLTMSDKLVPSNCDVDNIQNRKYDIFPNFEDWLSDMNIDHGEYGQHQHQRQDQAQQGAQGCVVRAQGGEVMGEGGGGDGGLARVGQGQEQGHEH